MKPESSPACLVLESYWPLPDCPLLDTPALPGYDRLGVESCRQRRDSERPLLAPTLSIADNPVSAKDRLSAMHLAVFGSVALR